MVIQSSRFFFACFSSSGGNFNKPSLSQILGKPPSSVLETAGRRRLFFGEFLSILLLPEESFECLTSHRVVTFFIDRYVVEETLVILMFVFRTAYPKNAVLYKKKIPLRIESSLTNYFFGRF